MRIDDGTIDIKQTAVPVDFTPRRSSPLVAREMEAPSAREQDQVAGTVPDPSSGGLMRRRSPGVALMLSLLVPGLGQAYNGERKKGVQMLIGTVLLWLVLAGFAIWIWSMVDAYREAKRLDDRYHQRLARRLNGPPRSAPRPGGQFVAPFSKVMLWRDRSSPRETGDNGRTPRIHSKGGRPPLDQRQSSNSRVRGTSNAMASRPSPSSRSQRPSLAPPESYRRRSF